MAYYPKSKCHQEVSNGNYLDQEGRPYYGVVTKTYNNKVFAGESYSGEELHEANPGNPGTSPITGSVAKKRYPTEKEREQGYMDRYFQQDIRTRKIVEIYPEDYSSSILGASSLAKKTFAYATASWCLGGKPVEDQMVMVGFRSYVQEGIRTYNSKSIVDLEKILPGISSSGVLCNPLEHIG